MYIERQDHKYKCIYQFSETDIDVLSLPAASAHSNTVVQEVANEISLKKKRISEMVCEELKTNMT